MQSGGSFGVVATAAAIIDKPVKTSRSRGPRSRRNL